MLSEHRFKTLQDKLAMLVELINARTEVERKIAAKLVVLAKMQKNARAELMEALQAKLDELEAPGERVVGQ